MRSPTRVRALRPLTAIAVSAAFAATALVGYPPPALAADAQPIAWVRSAGGAGGDGGTAVAVDASGAATVTGSFSGSATFGTGAEAVTVTGDRWSDVFVARYDADGGLAWVRSASGGSFDVGSGVAVDPTGSATVVGSFSASTSATGIISGSLTFGSGPEAVTLTSTRDEAFIARYDADGTLVWAQSAGGPGIDGASGVAVDARGSATVVGEFSDSATFGSGADALTMTAEGYTDAFVARYDADGTPVWVRTVGGAGHSGASEVALDGTGAATVTGTFHGSATFGSGSEAVTLESHGFSDVFVARYDPEGTLAWVRQAGGSSYDGGQGVSVDATGAATVVGSFEESAVFRSGAAAVTLSSAGSGDVFLARYTPDGTLAWVTGAGGRWYDTAAGVAMDAAGAVTVTGSFSDAATFGSGAESVTLASNEFSDIFVARYGADGRLIWAGRAGGTSADAGRGIALDGRGAATVTGSYWQSADFGPRADEMLASAGGDDIFVARYDTGLPIARVWGQTAVGTAAALSQDAFPSGAATVYVATVEGYWDALSGGAAAARQGGPLLLTGTGSLPQETRDELARLRPSTIVVQGGELAISAAVESELQPYAPTVTRNAGDTAIGTAVLTSQRAFPSGASSVFVATAASFHDGLSGGPAAGRLGAPVLLVEPTGTVDARVTDEIRRLGATTIHLLGGPLALPDSIQAQLAATGVPVQRLWGQSELGTSLAINRAMAASAEQAYLVTSQAYYDGLAAAPAANRNGGTVVLTNGLCLQADAREYLLSLDPSRVVVVGGTLAMAPALDQLAVCAG